jgi:hypothetical protein
MLNVSKVSNGDFCVNVSKVSNGDFCVKFHVRSKKRGFDWVLVLVYGAAQDEKKSEFLSELVRM